MLTLLESLRSALLSIRAHTLRSFLTTLGIVIGVASTIAVVSVVQGLAHSVNAQLEGLGSNTLTINSSTPFKEALQGNFAKLTHADLELISSRVEGVEAVIPILNAMGQRSLVRYGSQSEISRVYGSSAEYLDIMRVYPTQGRYLTRHDDKSRRKVAVIGHEVHRKLNLPDEAVGEYIEYGGEWFKIIGMLEKRGDFLGFNQDDYVILPYGTMRSLIGTQQEPDIQIQLRIADVANMEAISYRIERLLRNQHNLKPGQPNDFKIQTPEQLLESFNKITDTMTAVLSGIVGVSLIVGGIGIMNIMLVSVTERTREIGICKALGAQRHHILLQFLIEAIALSLLGGLIGLLLGYGLGVLVATMIPGFPPANVPLWAIGLAFGFSALVGILFGILPAAKAANLDPIDALRYE